MTITARRIDNDLWEATDGASEPTVARVILRPDGRRQLIAEHGVHAGVLQALLSRVRADVPGELVHDVDENDTNVMPVLRAAGFRVARTELTVLITLDGDRLRSLARATEGARIDLISAADADLSRLRALDEAIREDIPGSEGWAWTPEGFVRETFSADFDPATYRIAVEPSSGEYLGLLRVWMKADGPAFGCLGVRRGRRGTRVTAVLVADVFSTLLHRGFGAVRAGVDATNRASLGVVGRFEHRVITRSVELVHPGD